MFALNVDFSSLAFILLLKLAIRVQQVLSLLHRRRVAATLLHPGRLIQIEHKLLAQLTGKIVIFNQILMLSRFQHRLVNISNLVDHWRLRLLILLILLLLALTFANMLSEHFDFFGEVVGGGLGRL